MHWFKHFNNFRNSASMKMIADALGDRGTAVAYRLLEVVCDACGSGENYDPVFVLEPPHDIRWLANEIFIADPSEPYDAGISVKECEKFLQVYSAADLIVLGTSERPRLNGKLEKVTEVFPTIQLVGFEQNLDEWTDRKHKGTKAKTSYKKVSLATRK